MESPTVRKIVEQARLMLEAELANPIVLGFDGRVMDGMRRVARALMESHAEVDAVRFPGPVGAELSGCSPDELPY